jgi:hypothetical protein
MSSVLMFYEKADRWFGTWWAYAAAFAFPM